MKTLICVELSNFKHDLLKKKINEFNLIDSDELHFVHAFRINVYADNFLISSYPTEDEQPKIKESVLSALGSFTNDFDTGNAKIVSDCLFSVSPKEAIVKYIEENKIDKIVVVTRKKHNLFSSSFTEYLLSHTEAEIVVLREK
jgi:nucleotide-binding universal stress UspA family protein